MYRYMLVLVVVAIDVLVVAVAVEARDGTLLFCCVGTSVVQCMVARWTAD